MLLFPLAQLTTELSVNEINISFHRTHLHVAASIYILNMPPAAKVITCRVGGFNQTAFLSKVTSFPLTGGGYQMSEANDVVRTPPNS